MQKSKITWSTPDSKAQTSHSKGTSPAPKPAAGHLGSVFIAVVRALCLPFLCLLLATSASAVPELVLNGGHIGEVTHLTYSPDGKWVASGSKDGYVKIWDVASGTLRAALPNHHGPVLAEAFTHEGREIVVVGSDGVVTRWDPTAASLTTSNPGPIAAPESAAVAERAGTVIVATTGPDHGIKLWNLPEKDGQNPTVLASLDGHTTRVNCLAFSHDAAELASGGNDGAVKIWDVDDESLVRTVRGHAMPVRSVTFTADGKLCADASDDGISEVWNVQSGKNAVELQMNRPGDGVGAVAFSPDGSTALTGGSGGIKGNEFAELWDVHAGAVKKALIGHTRYVSSAAFSPDGTLVATSGRDETVRIWKVAEGLPAQVLGGTDAVPSVVFAQNGSVLVCGGADGFIRVWSLRTGELIHAYSAGAAVNSVAMTADGSSIIAGCEDKAVRLYDFATGELKETVTVTGPVEAVAASPDGVTIAAGFLPAGETGLIRLWNAKTKAVLGTIDQNGALSTVRSLAFSADGITKPFLATF